MRVFDESKQNELSNFDLEKGYLKADKLCIAHHDEVQAVEEQGHYETIAEYPNGGKDLKWVVDVEKVEHKDAYDEYEDIQVFVPYTAEEIEKRKAEKYPALVEKYIREKYTLSAELAILRQREVKTAEFDEYNAYAESCKERAKAEIREIYGD